jgi:SAM-dependent methyltransferase
MDTSAHDDDPLPGSTLEAERMPGHWLLARLGKRVLRPGGRELTDRLLESLAIGPDDHVVELAPGLGSTTELVLAAGPASYTGVDRDPAAAQRVHRLLDGPDRTVVQGSAAATGLPSASADVAFGEAYLTMQPARQKREILHELARVVRPGGRIGVHEVAFAPDDLDEKTAARIADDLRSSIKVNVSPLTLAGWSALLDEAGFDEVEHMTAPLHLLEPRRLVSDEGLPGALRFVSRVLRQPDARRRVLAMRSAMRSNADHLQACVITATRRAG